MQKWTADQMPDQTGRIAVITGANSGLGYETALALARKGAHIIMAVRNTRKGEVARAEILKQVPQASVELMRLELGSQQAIRAFAAAYRARFNRLDMLINNAGLMATPYGKTEDGFETQLGVNHLGHFALTGLLIDLLIATSGSRVVTVSSSAQYLGKINFANLHGEHGYHRYMAYCHSKLANVLFAFELQRRLDAAGAGTLSFAVHPGLAHTNLQMNTADNNHTEWERAMYKIVLGAVAQSQAQGALPELYAATAPGLKGGTHYAPDGILGGRGYPIQRRAAGAAYDRQTAARLWQVSEELTGVHYEFLIDTPEHASVLA